MFATRSPNMVNAISVLTADVLQWLVR